MSLIVLCRCKSDKEIEPIDCASLVEYTTRFFNFGQIESRFGPSVEIVKESERVSKAGFQCAGCKQDDLLWVNVNTIDDSIMGIDYPKTCRIPK